MSTKFPDVQVTSGPGLHSAVSTGGVGVGDFMK